MKKSATDWFESANAKIELYDFPRAINDLTKAIKLNPDYADAYYYRGWSYLHLGQKSEALADFIRARDFGVRVPQVVLDSCK